MHCPHCGNQVPDTARACGHCGQWLDTAPPRRGLPGWVWGVVGGVIVAAAVVGVLLATGVISLSGRQATAPPATPAPVPTSTSPPTPTLPVATPETAETAVPEPTPTPTQDPVVENVEMTNLPDTPYGLKVTCLEGTDTLQSSSTCPVIKWDGYTYWAYSHHDNRIAMTIVAYDTAGNVVQQWYRTGARYVVQITVDTAAKTVTFLGQDGQTIVMTWDELRVTEPAGGAADPVRVGLNAGEKQLPANTPVVLTTGWVADTSEQVADWLASVDLVVTLDGRPLPDTDDYWGEIEETKDYDEDGDAEYASPWRYPVGILGPGTHSVETEYRLQWPVTDGFDDDGDGALDEYYEPWGYPLQIIVEE